VLLLVHYLDLRLLGFELVLYKTGMGDGQQANNLVTRVSDPITRVSWDNYVTVSNADAKLLVSNEIANGGLNGSYATADGLKLDNVPVIVQPGGSRYY
jgi:molybdopterin-containing oxidoreductase family iron-sulfur binding subunit